MTKPMEKMTKKELIAECEIYRKKMTEYYRTAGAEKDKIARLQAHNIRCVTHMETAARILEDISLTL